MVRQYGGPVAAEAAVLCRPSGGAGSVELQAQAAFRALAESLVAGEATYRDVVSETLFLRDLRADLPVVLEARERVLGETGQTVDAPRPFFIEQAPVAADRPAVELAASVVVPHDRAVWSVQDVPGGGACDCDGCTRSGARIVRIGDQVSLYTANLYGAGGDAFDQSLEMFRAAERLVRQHGVGFENVVRTWIHLADIDRDYDALNRARRQFFDECGLDLRPASTGVQGGPFPKAHVVSLSLQAMRSSESIDVRRMSTPTLNEAWSYGADFSRGLRVVEANKVTLHVSGTASIDEAGQTVHVGDFDAQAVRMLDNIESLLEGQGATFGDLASGVAFVKRPADAAALRGFFERRGFAGFPLAVVHAPLCRPELLCETEVVAVLDRPPRS